MYNYLALEVYQSEGRQNVMSLLEGLYGGLKSCFSGIEIAFGNGMHVRFPVFLDANIDFTITA